MFLKAVVVRHDVTALESHYVIVCYNNLEVNCVR